MEILGCGEYMTNVKERCAGYGRKIELEGDMGVLRRQILRVEEEKMRKR